MLPVPVRCGPAARHCARRLSGVADGDAFSLLGLRGTEQRWLRFRPGQATLFPHSATGPAPVALQTKRKGALGFRCVVRCLFFPFRVRFSRIRPGSVASEPFAPKGDPGFRLLRWITSLLSRQRCSGKPSTVTAKDCCCHLPFGSGPAATQVGAGVDGSLAGLGRQQSAREYSRVATHALRVDRFPLPFLKGKKGSKRSGKVRAGVDQAAGSEERERAPPVRRDPAGDAPSHRARRPMRPANPASVPSPVALSKGRQPERSCGPPAAAPPVFSGFAFLHLCQRKRPLPCGRAPSPTPAFSAATPQSVR